MPLSFLKLDGFRTGNKRSVIPKFIRSYAWFYTLLWICLPIFISFLSVDAFKNCCWNSLRIIEKVVSKLRKYTRLFHCILTQRNDKNFFYCDVFSALLKSKATIFCCRLQVVVICNCLHSIKFLKTTNETGLGSN